MKKIPKKSEILKNWYLFGLDVDLSILLLFFCVQSKILRIYEHFINQNYFFFYKNCHEFNFLPNKERFVNLFCAQSAKICLFCTQHRKNILLHTHPKNFYGFNLLDNFIRGFLGSKTIWREVKWARQ